MFDYKQKTKLKNILYSPLVVSIVVIIALYSLYSTWTIYHKLELSQQDLVVSQRQLLALDAQNTNLDEQVSDLQTPSGMEDEIRTKFGEAKAGESMAVIVETDDGTSTPVAAPALSVWQKMLKFFHL